MHTSGLEMTTNGAHSHPGSTVTVAAASGGHQHALVGSSGSASSEPQHAVLLYCMKE